MKLFSRVPWFVMLVTLCIPPSGFAESGTWLWYPGCPSPGFASKGAAKAKDCATCMPYKPGWAWEQSSCRTTNTATSENGSQISVYVRHEGVFTQGSSTDPFATTTRMYGSYQEDQPQPDCEKTDNPVVVARGEKTYRFNDMTLSGAFPLNFQRVYRVKMKKISGDPYIFANWSWTYFDKRLIYRAGANKVSVVTDDGRGAFNFTKISGVWTSQDAGFYNELERVPSSGTQTGWRFLPGGGGSEEYDMDGYLTKVTSKNGLSHTISYVFSADFLESMSITDDVTQHTLKVVMDTGYPSRVVLLDSPSQSESGRPTVYYERDEDERLIAVIYPDDDVDSSNDPVQAFAFDATANAAYSMNNALVTGIFELTRSEYDAGLPYPESKRYSKVTYDSTGRVTSSALWDGTQKTEELTFAYSWTWSSATTSPVTTVTNAAGVSTDYTFSTSTALNNSNSLNDWKLVSVDGEADSATGCAATSANTTYASGYLSTTTDKSGNAVTKRTRDGQGRITTLQTGLNSSEVPNAASRKTVTTYSGSTSLPASKTYYGHSTDTWVAYRSESFTYDGNNRLTARSETDLVNSGSRNWGYTTTYHSGTLVPATVVVNGPRSDVTDTTTHTYNAVGQLTSTTNALGHVTEYSDYNSLGFPETIEDPNGTVTTLVYDARGRLTSSTTASAATTIDYWPNGLVKKITSPDSSWLAYTYNSAHQLTGITNQRGDSISLTPGLLNGQWTSAQIADSNSNVVWQQSRVFDALGRVWKQRDAASNDKTVYNYDANDNLRAVIALGDSSTAPTYDNVSRVTTRAFDRQNRLTSESRCTDSTPPTPPYSCASPLAVTEYDYDDQGNIKTVTDAEGHATDYTYNGFGGLVTQVSPDTGTTTYTYDAAGNLASKTKAVGTADQQVISYTWDALNRLSTINYPGSDRDVSYTYDESGHGAGVGRLTHVTDASGRTDYSYDTAGNVVTQTDTRGSLAFVTEYTYTANNELASVTLPSGQTEVFTRSNGVISSASLEGMPFLGAIDHQPFGGVSGWNTSTTGGYDRYERQFDANGRLAQWYLRSGGAASHVHTLSYDAYGNISGVQFLDDSTHDEQYEYDGLSRLTGVTAPYGKFQYSYDAVGNRLTQVISHFDPATQAWEEFYSEAYGMDSASNRLDSITRSVGGISTRSRHFTYDARGNITDDRRKVYAPDGVTVQSDKSQQRVSGNSDRLDAINHVTH